MTNIYHGYTEPTRRTRERLERMRLQADIVVLERVLGLDDCECLPISELVCPYCRMVIELKEKRAQLAELQGGNSDCYFYNRGGW